LAYRRPIEEIKPALTAGSGIDDRYPPYLWKAAIATALQMGNR